MLNKQNIVLPLAWTMALMFSMPSHAGVYGLSKLAKIETTTLRAANAAAHIKPKALSTVYKPLESSAYKPTTLAFKPSATVTLPHTPSVTKSLITVPKTSIPKPAVPSATHGGHKLLQNRAWEGPYGHLKNHASVANGKNFTQAAKNKIYQENYLRNGLQLRDDVTGQLLTKGKTHVRGFTPPKNEAQIDHFIAKSRGGSNSFGNAQVLSRQYNLAKSNLVN